MASGPCLPCAKYGPARCFTHGLAASSYARFRLAAPSPRFRASQFSGYRPVSFVRAARPYARAPFRRRHHRRH